jgi:hypothetical protein
MDVLLSLFLALAADQGVYRVESTPAETERLLAGNDDDWRTAGRLSFGPSTYRTGFRALWSRPACTCVSTSRSILAHDDEGQPLEEEVVEIFSISTARDELRRIELSPANVVCDVRMVRAFPKGKEVAFDLRLQSRVVLGRSGWTGTIWVPGRVSPAPSAANVSLPPRPGDRWRFNVYRIERPQGKKKPAEGAIFASWSPTGQESFHVPQSFQLFEFAPYFDAYPALV